MTATYPIYCINLEHRQDRKEQTLQQLAKLEIPVENVSFPHLTKDARGGVYGCYDSHMKVWNDFFINYPEHDYCLIFEDDFQITERAKMMMGQANQFVIDNYNDVDILFLHHFCVNVNHPKNNRLFTNGYGMTTHAYFITRRYIQSVITKYGKLPEPTGFHFDFELTVHKFGKPNWLYTENAFFATLPCIKQSCSPSDNTPDINNIFDNMFDINRRIEISIYEVIIARKMGVSDDGIKMIQSLANRAVF